MRCILGGVASIKATVIGHVSSIIDEKKRYEEIMRAAERKDGIRKSIEEVSKRLRGMKDISK